MIGPEIGICTQRIWPFDPKAGKAAYEELEGRLRSIPDEKVVPALADVEAAAITALAVADIAHSPAARGQLAQMPTLDAWHVDNLAKVAWAAWYCRAQALSESAASGGDRVPAEVIDAESERKQRMMKALDYNLGHLPEVANDLASIRAGSGYKDLASDLTRLANLYEKHADELADDKRWYRRTDLEDARKGARKIIDALAPRGDGSWARMQSRTWTLLLESYEEVRGAMRWLRRHDPDVDDQFPSLYAAARGGGRARKPAESPPASETSTPANPT